VEKMEGGMEESSSCKEKMYRGIEKGTKTLKLIVNPGESAGPFGVVSWKEYVLPQVVVRGMKTAAGPI
jgi:hypothetical protein